MIQDPASLDNLSDIAVPPPVSWWPLAPGWWFVIIATMMLIAVSAWRFWLRWNQNAYRRTALVELRNAESAFAIAEILKRTALAAFPRADVASLSGQAWCKFLDDTMDGPFDQTVAEALMVDLYSQTDGVQSETLRRFASQWIGQHRVPRGQDHEARSC